MNMEIKIRKVSPRARTYEAQCEWVTKRGRGASDALYALLQAIDRYPKSCLEGMGGYVHFVHDDTGMVIQFKNLKDCAMCGMRPEVFYDEDEGEGYVECPSCGQDGGFGHVDADECVQLWNDEQRDLLREQRALSKAFDEG